MDEAWRLAQRLSRTVSAAGSELTSALSAATNSLVSSGSGFSVPDSDYIYDSSDEHEKHPDTANATCMDENSVMRRQEEDAEEISEDFGVDAASATLLLRSVGWDKEQLVSQYYEDPRQVFLNAGLPDPNSTNQAVISQEMTDFTCGICCSEGAMRVTACAAGHRYCDECWGSFISMKVQEGDTIITCPEDKCDLQVTEQVVHALCDVVTSEKYKRFLACAFVAESDNTVWCPFADCGLAVNVGHGAVAVMCARGHRFCASPGCKINGAHAPATCASAAEWLQKCQDDTETFKWLSANTQTCPNAKCSSTIEKNGGCNHMTCKKCKHHFCWVCLGDWSSHNDYYSCNKFDPEKLANRKKEGQESRAALERYLHFYHRYQNHANSLKLEAEYQDRSEKRMLELQ
eukprot:gene9463-11214_t